MDRRSFLRMGAGALGALAAPPLLSACRKERTTGGGDAGPSPAQKGLPGPVQEFIDGRVQNGAVAGLDVFQGGSGYIAGVPSYLGFVIGLEGTPKWGHDATIWLLPDPAVPGARVGPVPAPYHGYAKPGPEPSPQGVLGATATFDRPGVWYLVAEAEVDGKRRVGWAAYKAGAKESSKVPYAGRPALRTETPTDADHRGVDPICTREPACGLHQMSLAAALGAGRPVLFEVGTPKFCTSRTCGPNLDELVVVRDQVGDKAAFVHAEVYVNDKLETVSRQEVTPAFREWGLESEPWLFVIDRNGTVATRFEGPLTAPQIMEAVKPLL